MADFIDLAGLDAFALEYLPSDTLNLQAYFEREPAMFERMRRTVGRSSSIGLSNTLRATVGSRVSLYSLEERLGRLAVPALVIVGDRDHLCTNPSKYLANVIPGAQLLVLPDCGHMTNLERTEEFNRALIEFLRGVEGR